MQVTAEVSEASKIISCNMTSSCIELSEIPNSFVKIFLVFKIKDIASFIKKVISQGAREGKP